MHHSSPLVTLPARPRRTHPIPALFVLLALMAALVSVAAAPASAADVNHGRLVPERSSFGFPKILNGEVRAIAVVGETIVAGGTFTSIERTDGSVVSQRYLAAFDIDSGELIETFRPILNREVLAVHASVDTGAVYVGGAFTTIDGVTRNRFAELSLSDGAPTNLVSNVDGRVQAIEVTSNGRVFLGGLFRRVKGRSIERVAEINPTNGQPNTAFSFDFSGLGSARIPNQDIKMLSVTPNNQTLAIVHGAARIDGQPRRGAATIRIANPAAPTLNSFSIDSYWNGSGSNGAWVTDGDLSPNGNVLAVGTSGGDGPPWHDMVLTWDINTGSSLWQHRMRDSVYSIAVSDVAVYAGGHFCRIDAGPGSTNVNGQPTTCTGSDESGAWRDQMSAHALSNGTPLDWDPGSNAFRGVVTMELTPRGLLIGQDRSSAGGRTTGRLAFFDLGGVSDTTAPSVSISTPVANQSIATPTIARGSASDNNRVRQFKIRLKDRATGFFLQPNGSFSASFHEFVVAAEANAAGSNVDWSFAIPALANGDYRLQVRAADHARNSTAADRFFSVGAPQAPCSVSVVGSTVRVTWLPIPGEDTYFVRRNGGFAARVNGGTSYLDSPGTGSFTYLVRSRQNGTTTNVACTPTTVVVR